MWILIAALLLLCQCATQHQPLEFEAFFRTDPAGYFHPSYVYERTALEARTDLNVYEMRRLQDLYELELRQVDRASPRHEALTAAIRRLSEKTQRLADRVDRVRRDAQSRQRGSQEAEPVFRDAEFKKQYFQVYRLWNRDENAAALEQAVVLASPEKVDELSDKEKFKALGLQLRIALDVPDLSLAAQAYERLREVDDCAQEVADAGFLMAMTYLGAGDARRAEQIFSKQCDPDESAANRVKRAYWTARLKEATGESAAQGYQDIAGSGVPGYYSFLAHVRLGRSIKKADFMPASYRAAPLTVPSSVAGLLDEAEVSLKHNLRYDAAAYLLQASNRLRNGAGPDEVPALLYTAHLFQASGQQLEAMKIYADVAEIAQEPEAPPIAFDFLPEMFPSPHASFVSRVGKEWKMDPDFLYAIMRQESAFNPGAVSSANARGLMQLMPFIGEELAKYWKYETYYSKNTLFFAHENLKFAVFHLQQLQAKMKHPALVAAAYNAGATRVSAWGKRGAGMPMDVFVELIPILETRNYVKLVLRNYVYYRLLHNGVFPPNAIAQLLSS